MLCTVWSDGLPGFLMSEEESGMEVVPELSPGCHASLQKDMEISKIINKVQSYLKFQVRSERYQRRGNRLGPCMYSGWFLMGLWISC